MLRSHTQKAKKLAREWEADWRLGLGAGPLTAPYTEDSLFIYAASYVEAYIWTPPGPRRGRGQRVGYQAVGTASQVLVRLLRHPYGGAHITHVVPSTHVCCLQAIASTSTLALASTSPSPSLSPSPSTSVLASPVLGSAWSKSWPAIAASTYVQSCGAHPKAPIQAERHCGDSILVLPLALAAEHAHRGVRRMLSASSKRFRHRISSTVSRREYFSTLAAA